MYLFDHLGLVQELGLNRDKLSRFLREVERGYDAANLYHNSAHAASVLHMMHAFLEHGGLMKALSPILRSDEGCGGQPDAMDGSVQLERMACLVAAAVHDFEHKGLSNEFLVKTGDERAVRYNNEQVNENHHVAAALNLFLCPEYNFMESFPRQTFHQFWSLVSDLVLGTDMDLHGTIMSSAREAFVTSSAVEGLLLLKLAMKCSDLGHTTLQWGLHSQWVRRIEQEFFLQGDKEREAGLPISFLMDRFKPGATATQVGFFDAVVLPLFRLLAQAAPGAARALAAVEANYRRWRELEEVQQELDGEGRREQREEPAPLTAD